MFSWGRALQNRMASPRAPLGGRLEESIASSFRSSSPAPFGVGEEAKEEGHAADLVAETFSLAPPKLFSKQNIRHRILGRWGPIHARDVPGSQPGH